MTKKDTKDTNAIARRRDEYIEGLNEAYTHRLGEWLAKQTEEKQKRIRRHANNFKHGLTSVAPLICKGRTKCPFFHACPIPVDIEKPGPDSDYPINLPCPLEVEFVAQKTVDYMDTLDVDPADPVEMSLIQELALLDNYRNRAALILAGGDLKGGGRDLMTTEDVVTTWDADGNPNLIQNYKEHPAVNIMDKHEKRRAKILEQFNATRQTKVKLYGGSIETHSRIQQDLENIRAFIDQIGKSGMVLTSTEASPVLLDKNIQPLLITEDEDEE